MSRIASIFLFVLMAGAGYGQQEHFALIRADNDQPFYVRIRQQTLSSSAQGHLILSQLHDSLYPIAIGFPRQQFPEQEFNLRIDGNDLDLRLIYRQGRGWVLVDMNTQAEQLPGNDTTGKKTHLEGIKKDDAFSRMMADVVSDTAVMYNTYAEEASRDSAARIADSLARRTADSLAARKVADSIAARRTADSLASRNAAPLATASAKAGALPAPPPPAGSDSAAPRDSAAARRMPAPAPDTATTPPVHMAAAPPVLKASAFTGTLDSLRVDSSVRHTDSGKIAQKASRPAKPAHIEKISERQTAAGLRISYTDGRKGHHTDTINIQIPRDSNTQVDSSRKTAPRDTARRSSQGSSPPPGGTTQQSGTLPQGGTPPQTSAPQQGSQPPITPPQTGTPVPAPARTKLVVVNSDCHNFASDDDVDKLKVKFQALSTDDAKIAAAKKIFKLKCFTTNQLKGLSESFLTEEGKYRFLQASYPFVSDDGFKGLSDIFTDPVYIAKFKTLVGTP